MTKPLPPGIYTVVIDPNGEVVFGCGFKARVVGPAPTSIESTVVAWLSSPINDYGTPYVAIPEDFTPEEQGLFVDLIREPRLVTRDEQISKLQSIVAARATNALFALAGIEPDEIETIGNCFSM